LDKKKWIWFFFYSYPKTCKSECCIKQTEYIAFRLDNFGVQEQKTY